MMDAEVSASVMAYIMSPATGVLYFINSAGKVYSFCNQSSWVDGEKAEFLTRFHWNFLISV